jgi:glycosyltransferase involved in cell wall biosynthesis
MRIAINTRFLLSNKMEGFGWYTYEISKRLVENHPEHEFFFFFDRPFDEKFVFAKNVTPIVLFPPARHPFLFYYWFNFSVTKALKKHKIDLFFSPDGYLSLKTNVPQLATIHDLNFEHYPEDLPKSARKYLKHFFPKFAEKAKKIITVSEFSKQDIHQTYGIDLKKISVIWNAASDEFKPIDEEKAQSIRNKFSNGKEFFIFIGALHPRKNVQKLIDAFSIFKQKHPNSYDLLIVGENLWNKNNLLNLPNNLNNNIHFTGHLSLNDLCLVTASASCLTYIPYFEGFGIPLVEAMKCGIPIISGNLTSLLEVVGDAGLLVNPFSEKEVAQAMEQVFLDENLRNELKKKSLERSQIFSWDLAAEKVWEEISQIIHKDLPNLH